MVEEGSRIIPDHAENLEKQKLKDKSQEFIQTKLDNQTWWLRRLAFSGSVIVILGMTCLEIHIFKVLVENRKISDLQVIDSTLATIAIVPLASITAITIAILVGVFRRYHGNEISNTGDVLRITGENL